MNARCFHTGRPISLPSGPASPWGGGAARRGPARRTRRSACRAAGRRPASRRASGVRWRRVRSWAEILHCPSLGRELALVECPELGERRRLGRALVVADLRDAGEAEREPRAIRRTLLDLVVRDLDDDLGPDAHGVAVIRRRDLPETRGHVGELSVGEPLERLADV